MSRIGLGLLLIGALLATAAVAHRIITGTRWVPVPLGVWLAAAGTLWVILTVTVAGHRSRRQRDRLAAERDARVNRLITGLGFDPE